jgi:hypothetical protein
MKSLWHIQALGLILALTHKPIPKTHYAIVTSDS